MKTMSEIVRICKDVERVEELVVAADTLGYEPQTIQFQGSWVNGDGKPINFEEVDGSRFIRTWGGRIHLEDDDGRLKIQPQSVEQAKEEAARKLNLSESEAENLPEPNIEDGKVVVRFVERDAAQSSVSDPATPEDVPCDFCGASPGEPCRTRSGNERDQSHKKRVEKFEG